MDDILQTSVHAFLRTTEVKYCRFVYENAGSNIEGEVGRTKFTLKLNQFTLDAAKEEKREYQFKLSPMLFNLMTIKMFIASLDCGKGIHQWPQSIGNTAMAAQKLKQQVVNT